ncbi:MAG: outer membrane protein assembly factor BamA, partial [Balneolaceae bacterium]
MDSVPRQFEIQAVEVEGLVTARETFIISTSGLNVGNRITIPGEEIPNAMRQLNQTGLFSDIEIRYRQVPGGVSMLIRVQEEPRLDSYEIEGVRRSQRRDLRDQLNLLTGFSVTNAVRSQALSTIKRYFRGRGHWGTEVELIEEITDEQRNRVKLTFIVDRGERTKVREFLFEGNEHFDDSKLRKEFGEIKRDRWWKIFRRHTYNEDDFELGKENLIQFYRNNGFLDMRMLTDTVYVDDWRGKEGVYLDFKIEEGPQYRVRNITFEGNTVYTDDRLKLALGFEQGDVFNESKFNENLRFRRDDGDITSLYENIGYLFFRAIPDIRVVGDEEVDLHVDIIEDEIATIRSVSFTGNTKTHDNVVRRNLRTVPGETYSRAAVIRTIRELGQLGYFAPEAITPDLIPDRQESAVDIIYSLDENQGSDNFEFSGGFGGRSIGVILAARVNFNNFSVQRMFQRGGWNPIPSGDGQRLSLGVQVTGRGFQSYNFSFTEPWFRGRPTSVGLSLSYDLVNFRGNQIFPNQVSDRQRNELFTAALSVGRRLSWPDDFFTQRTTLTYNRFNVQGFNQVFQDGTADILSIGQEIERNSTDNVISPNSGSRFSIGAEVAMPLPDFAEFYKIRTSYQNHQPVVGRLIFTSSAQYGYMGHFTQNNRTNFQRFFLGGTQLQQRQNFLNENIDMRGFPGGLNGVISPLDDRRNLIGGRVFSKYSLEMRIPAVRSEQLQLIPYVFMDAGNTFNSLSEFDPFEVKRAAGFGSR